NMLSGLGRVGVVGLVIFSFGCSTEDTGLRNVEAGVHSVTEVDADEPPRPVKKDAAPDKAPATMPDATADAPGDAPAMPDATPTPDLKPDLPPRTDQPQGAACGDHKEC